MDRKHREAIDSCYNDVVPRINIIKLWPKLLENRVFNRDDVNISHWKKNLTDIAVVQDIYLTVKTRGPFAFDRFLASLRQSGHEDQADILEGKRVPLPYQDPEICKRSNDMGNDVNEVAPSFISAVEESRDNFFHDIQSSELPLQIQVRTATSFLDRSDYESVQRYPMRSKPRGLVLIITNIDYKYSDKVPRSSAAYDELNLKQLFEAMGFRVIPYRNLTGEEMLDKVKEFSRRKELRSVDSCFVVISSHGCMNAQYEITEIEGVDYNPSSKIQNAHYKTVFCMDILDYFTAEACPDLAGKPKVFLFQLCRGDKHQRSVKEPRHTTDTSNFHSTNELTDPKKSKGKETMRNYSDMLVAHATLPGHVAFRDKVTGSWFIQILCEVFMNYAHQTHLQDLLNMVDERLKTQRTTKEECQTLTVTSIGFNKHCYLNPGLFERA